MIDSLIKVWIYSVDSFEHHIYIESHYHSSFSYSIFAMGLFASAIYLGLYLTIGADDAEMIFNALIN